MVPERGGAWRAAGQALAYALFAAFVGFFAVRPAWTHLGPGEAVVKVSIVHRGKPLGECRERSEEELARLPPNMRVKVVCPRERSPLELEVWLDGRLLHREVKAPSGLHHDGPSYIYHRFVVPAGEHVLRVRLRDSVRTEGYPYDRSERVRLDPGRALAVDFDPAEGIRFR